MKIQLNDNGQYGKFDLIVKEGWKISHSFFDNESNLLVVNTCFSKSYQNNSTNGISPIPTEEYIIDINIPAILTQAQWAKYFDYSQIIEIDDQEKLQSISQRYYDHQKERELIGYQLIDLKTGIQLLNGNRLAFDSKPKKNIIQEYLESRKKKQEYNDREKKFLAEIYLNWTQEEKAKYHIQKIHFQDKMQGGMPSEYRPAATYFAKWFCDYYADFDDDILKTLTIIAKQFGIDTKYLSEMIKFDETTNEWKNLAYKSNLIN